MRKKLDTTNFVLGIDRVDDQWYNITKNSFICDYKEQKREIFDRIESAKREFRSRP